MPGSGLASATSPTFSWTLLRSLVMLRHGETQIPGPLCPFLPQRVPKCCLPGEHRTALLILGVQGEPATAAPYLPQGGSRLNQRGLQRAKACKGGGGRSVAPIVSPGCGLLLKRQLGAPNFSAQPHTFLQVFWGERVSMSLTGLEDQDSPQE